MLLRDCFPFPNAAGSVRSAEVGKANTLAVSKKRFRVALSFPGEKRDFIRQVADSLVTALGKDSVLYDDYLTAELARPDLDLYLGALYREQSDLLVPFYCADYERKKWCKLEWRQMRDILFNVEGHRIMPFRFDDAPITGVLSIDGYVKIGSRPPQEVSTLILERVGEVRPRGGNPAPPVPALGDRVIADEQSAFGRSEAGVHLGGEYHRPTSDLTSDRATPAVIPQRATIREKSAAEILGHLKELTPSRFRESVEHLYLGRWTREPGWQAIVHDLLKKLSGGGWFCIFSEVGSGPLVAASTVRDLYALRLDDSVTVNGRISDVSRLSVSLEDAIVRGDNVPFP